MPDAAVPATDLGPSRSAALPADDLRDRLRAHVEHLQGAAVEETLRALRKDGARFATWCAARGVAALPTAPETLRAYILEAGSTLAVATVRRHVALIAHLHRAAGLPDPAKTEAVRLALRALARAKGTRQRQATALTEAGVAAILATTRPTTLLSLRDRTLLLVARNLLARRGELVALQVEELARGVDASATVMIRRSKTDQTGAGAIA